MLYFAYGSNMDNDQMKERKINFTTRKKGTLRDYKLVFNKKASRGNYVYANIEESKDELVEGALYEFPDKEIINLDKAEGFPRHYNKKEIIVFDENNVEVNAIVYIAQPAHIVKGLYPQREYLEHLLAGKDLISKSYFEELARTPVLEDL